MNTATPTDAFTLCDVINTIGAEAARAWDAYRNATGDAKKIALKRSVELDRLLIKACDSNMTAEQVMAELKEIPA